MKGSNLRACFLEKQSNSALRVLCASRTLKRSHTILVVRPVKVTPNEQNRPDKAKLGVVKLIILLAAPIQTCLSSAIPNVGFCKEKTLFQYALGMFQFDLQNTMTEEKLLGVAIEKIDKIETISPSYRCCYFRRGELLELNFGNPSELFLRGYRIAFQEHRSLASL